MAEVILTEFEIKTFIFGVGVRVQFNATYAGSDVPGNFQVVDGLSVDVGAGASLTTIETAIRTAVVAAAPSGTAVVANGIIYPQFKRI